MPIRVVDIRKEEGKPRPEVLADVLNHAAALAATERELGKLPRADLTAHWVARRLREQRDRHQQEATP